MMHGKKTWAMLTMMTGFSLTGCAAGGEALRDLLGRGELDTGTIVAGLKQALEVGTKNAVGKTSRPGGYWSNAALRIAMPEPLHPVAKALRTVGLGGQVDAFERKMNDAAESAAALATPLFVDAITSMTFADAKAILTGSETAATDYFRNRTTEGLAALYLPIVHTKMKELGVMQVYDDLLSRYMQLPLVPKPTISIERYVTDQALTGLFQVLGEQERLIRQDPAARTTELLRRVFSGT